MGLENPLHIAILLIIVLLVFGAKRLPEMGRSLGSGLRGFKDAINGDSQTPQELSNLTGTAPDRDAEPVTQHAAQAPAQPAAAERVADRHTEPVAEARIERVAEPGTERAPEPRTERVAEPQADSTPIKPAA